MHKKKKSFCTNRLTCEFGSRYINISSFTNSHVIQGNFILVCLLSLALAMAYIENEKKLC